MNTHKSWIQPFLFWSALAVASLWVLSNSIVPQARQGSFDVRKFSSLPILGDGRKKPFDTVARTSLMILRGKQSALTANDRSVPACQWLADTFFQPEVADTYRVFAIDNPEVLGLCGIQQTDRRYFSWQEIAPFLRKIDEQGQLAEKIDSAKRTPYQVGIYNLRNSLLLYQRLKNSLRPEGTKNFSLAISDYLKTIPSGLDAAMKRKNGQKFDQAAFDEFAKFTAAFQGMEESSTILPVPPDLKNATAREEWQSIGTSLLQSMSTDAADPVTLAYAGIGDAYVRGDVPAFNHEVERLGKRLETTDPTAAWRAQYEVFFNQLEPFYQAMGLYVLAFLLLCGSWLTGNRALNSAAFWILVIALALHTFGLGSRMYLQGRPPVTNLYSTAIFIGWFTLILGLLMEKIFHDGIGAACASVIGFVTLVIAHHLAGNGDTLEMLQAVLDHNIWLATHVLTIAIGYCAMFLAGILAIGYLIVQSLHLCGFLSSDRRSLLTQMSKMIYGVICFATLFSFVGTVLGGIWADQSWGRFWGWDPKENGALLIVLWCAIILHARWAGYIRQRGLVAMAIFGNAITSFSWFGVNMLGVGLHSYGFMNRAFPWLVGFIVLQIFLVVVEILLPSLPSQDEKTLRT